MVSSWKIFWIFAKIGAFTLGGGMAMIPLIQNEIVRRGWLEEKDFPDLIALSQAAPGLLAVNIAIFVGYKLNGNKGSVVAAIGSILPSFIIIMTIAMLFSGFQNNPVVASIFKGIRPVVVALIAVPMLQMAKSSVKKWWQYAISGLTLIAVGFLQVSPIYILGVVIVVFFALTKYRDTIKKDKQ